MSLASIEPPKSRTGSTAPARGERKMLFGPATWEQYKTLQGYFEQWGGGRVSYLDGTIELMTISLEHESRKSQVGRLLEAYLVEEEIEFFFHGSATLEQAVKRAGKEPDESYCFHTDKKVPDLVIEIAISRGGIDTLDLYRRWKISEVWIWQRDRLQVFHFDGKGYVPATQSRHFPTLDLELLESCARMDSPLQARKRLLAGSRKKRRK